MRLYHILVVVFKGMFAQVVHNYTSTASHSAFAFLLKCSPTAQETAGGVFLHPDFPAWLSTTCHTVTVNTHVTAALLIWCDGDLQ